MRVSETVLGNPAVREQSSWQGRERPDSTEAENQEGPRNEKQNRYKLQLGKTQLRLGKTHTPVVKQIKAKFVTKNLRTLEPKVRTVC